MACQSFGLVKTSTVSSAFRRYTSGSNGAVTACHNLFPARFFALYFESGNTLEMPSLMSAVALYSRSRDCGTVSRITVS